MRLSLAHRLLLLELDPETGLSGIPNLGLRWYALHGAILGELQLQDLLVCVQAERFVFATVPPPDGALGRAALPMLKRRRPSTLEVLMRQLYQRSMRTRKEFLSELLHGGLLTAEADRVLPWRTRWRPTGPAHEAQVEALRAWLASVEPTDGPCAEDLLLSLLRGTELLSRVWTERELVALRPTLEQRTARAPIGKLVRDMAMVGYDKGSSKGFSFS